MSLLLNIEQNLPPPIIQQISATLNIPVHRTGDFYVDKTGPGCGTTCIWNGAGYYGEHFVCGETYPSGLTFYCCSDCHRKVGASKKIFLSYRWHDTAIADKIEGCLQGAGIGVLRDVREMAFLDVISQFMHEASESRYFIAVMTEPYFQSRYCMFELSRLIESDLQIRTIPIMLGNESEPGIDEKRQSFWHERYKALSGAIAGIDERYSDYLLPELKLLKKIPEHLAGFFYTWRGEKRPEGKHWLLANCLYLAGAVKTTFRPTEEDAANWTYSNKSVRMHPSRIDDAPCGIRWDPQPFHLHAFSKKQTRTVTDNATARELVLDTHVDGTAPGDWPPGVHLVLIDEAALDSLEFCKRILELQDRADVTLIPMFLDEELQRPTGEVPLLQRWNERLVNAANETERTNIDAMLVRFGSMIECMRDTLVPGMAVFGDSAD